MSGIYAEAWRGRRAWVMSYVRPLSWMVLKALKELGWKALNVLVGMLAAIPIMLLFFWLQDLSGGTF